MERAEFEATLRQDGFGEIDERVIETAKAVPMHTHPFSVRALVLDGAITLRTADGDRTYGAGEVFVMPAGREHGETIGAEGVRYVVGRRRP